MKSQAVSMLRQEFGGAHPFTVCRPEVTLGANVDLPSGKEQRAADALLEFEQNHPVLGKGVIVEVQYRNEGKDLESTEQDYATLGYSTYWAYGEDFSEDRCLLTRENIEQNAWQSDWLSRFSPSQLPRFAEEAELPDKSVIDSWLPIESVRLPPDLCDREALRIWREQEWEDLFSGYTKGVTDLRDGSATATVYATLPPDLAYEMEDELYRIWDANLPKDVPPVEEWGDVHDDEWSGPYETEFERASVEVSVIFPEAFHESLRDELKTIWHTYRYNEYELAYRLSERNATRRCGYCSADADYYVRVEGLVSEFVCSQHRYQPLK